MEDYKLVQIYIPGSAGVFPGRAYYSVGLNGSYHARVLGISFADRAVDGTLNKMIRITSDCFQQIHGNLPQSIALASRAEHNMGNPQGEFPIILNTVGGNIDLTLSSTIAYNGVGNNYFDFAILTMKVKAIPRE